MNSLFLSLLVVLTGVTVAWAEPPSKRFDLPNGGAINAVPVVPDRGAKLIVSNYV